MRILAIGLGGAGCRVVDQLYDHDQRSRVCCMTPMAIDTEGNSLRQLRFIPDDARLHFPQIDPEVNTDIPETIAVEEVMTLLQKKETIEIDAIVFFTGLGGTVNDAIPMITCELRKAFIEPVFGVCTLPFINEGKKKAAKAVLDLNTAMECLDAIILFDNETWFKKIRAEYDEYSVKKDERKIFRDLFSRSFPDNPRDLYNLLNERLIRQFGLLLRAGEFNERGMESAEIVLDAGEVLNTLKGNGLTAIGYAAEEITTGLRAEISDRLHSHTYFTEGAHKRATRIVSLAKKAVYEDISIPCDLTSAEKALVLIAGPSKELSMKGFQTVRKWIDKSIAGLEMRSGDYPVRSTKYVGIIVMLSGLSNIPRVEEIKEMREIYLVECAEEESRREEEEMRRREEENAARIAEEIWEEDAWDREAETFLSGEAEVTDTFGEVNPERGINQEFVAFEDLFEDEGGAPPAEPATSREYIEAEQDYAAYKREASPRSQDEMIRMESDERNTPQKKEEKISPGMKPRKSNEREKLVLPGRQGNRENGDLTRSTDAGGNKAPKDSVFGPKAVFTGGPVPKKTGDPKDNRPFTLGNMTPKASDSSLTGVKVSVATAGSPNDSALGGRGVSVGQKMKINDAPLGGRSVNIRKSNFRPSDSSISGAGLNIRRTPQKTKEFIEEDAPVKMRTSVNAPRDDLLRQVENRLRISAEKGKKPVKEPLYKKGLIREVVYGNEPEEKSKKKSGEEGKDEDLFWIT